MIVKEQATSLPNFVVFLHRLTRMGGATKLIITPDTLSLSRFDLDKHDMTHFPQLADAATVWLQYRKKEV